MTALAPLGPELALVGASLVLILFSRRLRPAAAAALAAVGAAAALALSHWGPGGLGPSGLVVMDGYARSFKLLFGLNLGVTVLASMRRVEDERLPAAEYYALLLWAATGMMLAASALDLLTLWLGLELMALCSYVLVGLSRRPEAGEAAFKYLLLGSFASALLLYGFSLAYGLAGTTRLAEIGAALAAPGRGGPLFLAAVLLAACGLAFKIAAVPFHAWAPDAYEGAGAPVAGFLAVGSKAAGFAALGRLLLTAFAPERAAWAPVLAVLAGLSMVVGALMALSQTRLKRLLAYSSISHAGFALLGVLAGTPAGVAATQSYLLAYAFMTLGAFAVVAGLGPKGESLSGYEGLAAKRPGLAALLLVLLLSLTGIPPTAGFAAKFLVLGAALDAGFAWLAVLGVAMSVVSAFFYLRIAVLMYMSPAKGEAPARLPLPAAAAVAFAAAATLLGGILPEGLTAQPAEPVEIHRMAP